MRVKLENTHVIYHQETDSLNIACEAQNGIVLHDATGSALHSVIAWVCRRQAYEPKLYKLVMGGWRTFKKWILRRPVSQGRFVREIDGKDGYIVVTVEHFGFEPVKIPFLKRVAK